MISLPLWLIPAAPLALLILLSLKGARGAVRGLVPFAPVPALLAALADPLPLPITLDWLMLGTQFALTDLAATFLLFTSVLWGLAGWSAMRMLAADPQRDRFAALFLLAMAGNLGLLIAQDIVSFYAFFAMMSLASWGLVLHGGGAAQRRAGLVYVVFAVAGEVALFAGLAFAAHAAGGITLAELRGSDVPTVAAVLIAAGLLVKFGAVPLHLWLPLAHSAAPSPASAVLSGAMLKAGLFGLIVLLPPGLDPTPQAATLLAAMALAGLIVAPVLGLIQGDPKAVLAYSSIGQMSLMALGYAAGLAAPQAWPVIAPALVLLATHHAFSKAALFLGVPVVWTARPGMARAAIIAALLLPALALAGMPGTSGWFAKEALKSGLSAAPAGWAVWSGAALLVGSFGTALLMVRALTLLSATPHKSDIPVDTALPWGAMMAAVIVGLSVSGLQLPAQKPVHVGDILPILAAVLLAFAGSAAFRYGRIAFTPPRPGEILALFQREPAPTPLLALPAPPRSGRALARRPKRRIAARPEQGGLAILTLAAGLALVAFLADAPPPIELGNPSVDVAPK
ncbi:complex I subunit 5 family protein [Meridianimarinicoccus aquatilis]|uniref:NADH/ubiquinone/plastoquinone (Complex I) n=1 Tax=Meridianimarinicoccus aquatilis TaxID=2552766 RepID=A0A4V3BBF6_9RHOB|nr:complex I subunit 5 family protein [Fluviibacterium aquatile]TDL86909.1 NADH/ubiquinone/plastoquinone (complex I) [Fluviibacterium aquatile]